MSNQPIDPTVLLQQLQWRYATKKFDSTQKIPATHWQALEEALVLTPSSYGLQPWKFIIITDQSTKEKLVPVSWGQRQVADCSHVVVFAIKKNLSAADVDRYLERIAEVRGGTAQSLATYRKMMVSDVIDGPRSKIVNEWATRQAYIALGNFMTSAAMLGIDTCPMEGLEPDKYDAILGLPARGLATVVGCVAGYRAADDKYATLAKVRYPHDSMVERI
ncbi:MAG: NAD(P)H-dependent oxidoreductase [Verrucomicrobiota bacterium]